MNSDSSPVGTHADVLVLGFGKGGKTAAAQLGRLGKRVVLVEQSERMYGGTCPNVGCIPSKGMVHHSGLRRPEDPPQEFYARAVDEIQAVREFMRVGNRGAMDAMETVELITGRPVFVDPHTVRVEAGGGDVRTITADTILINTGSEPRMPDIAGLRESPRTMTSTDLLERRGLPERLVIIGAGPIGIEFAQIYRHFGSEVTLIAARAQILPEQDDDVAAAAHAILDDEGIRVVVGATVTEVRDETGGAVVVYEQDGAQHTVAADVILPAVGRTPATQGLGLDAAGVQTTDDGDVLVDDHLRTSQSHIYALGDVNGGPHHTYISLDDSRIVMDQLVGDGRRSRADRVAIPQTLFMTPPLATVGLTERAARDTGHRVEIAEKPVAEIIAMPRAYAVQETRGMMKFIIDAETDLVLGAALLSIDAQEVINTVALAIRHDITATELRDSVYTHPSTTEAFNEVLNTIVRADVPQAA
ncbi:MAG TPA: FAD-dependent oxidoreductase [Baekduia sp.]|jgi:pyruvate/2-oxoglutarate dehydrogenase complex dihydrolipoamide dehydrogenase (E3) component